MNNNRKIGIVTLSGYSNYGNRLQNYALKKVLEDMGGVVTSLIIDHPYSKSTKMDLNKMRLKNFLKHPVSKIKSKIIKSDYTENIENNSKITRTNIFKEFSNEYLNEHTVDTTNNQDRKYIKDISYFIVGSDQVWNPGNFLLGDKYFLTFVETDKRLSYAASFGVSEIPKLFQKSYKNWLNGMKKISVREEAGQDIAKELTRKDIEIHVDPTMLLSKKEWLLISKRAINRPDKPYILTYFLGGPSNKTREKLNRLAKKNDMAVINLGDITEKQTYETGPSEFLDYINNASAFFTDSFHGVVFSIIFETPFIVYKRIGGESMYSRIETILSNFNFKSREIDDFNEDIFSMDFTSTDKVLEVEFEKSINYLKDALRIEE